MKIEFKKVPQVEKDFSFSKDSVEFSGTFCRISQRLVKLESTIAGKCEVDCYKCGKEFSIDVNENLTFILSDGIFDSENEKEDEIIIEIDDHIIDFDLILSGELESIRSDYYTCDDCEDDSIVELEY